LRGHRYPEIEFRLKKKKTDKLIVIIIIIIIIIITTLSPRSFPKNIEDNSEEA